LKRRPVKHGDLAGMPMVVPAGAYQYYGLGLDLPPTSKPPVVAVETESRQALIPLVRAQAGITFLPRGLAENASRLGLVIADLDPPLQREVSLVTRPGPLSPAARVFAELARGKAGPAREQAPT
jgi:DNA-binding transcriptional LysR family regulator